MGQRVLPHTTKAGCHFFLFICRRAIADTFKLTRESRRTITNDRHAAPPPSCSPPCKSHAVISVCRTDHSSHCCIGIRHHFRLLNPCGGMLGNHSMAKIRSYDFMNPSSPSPGLLPSFLPFLYVLFISLHPI